MPRASTRVGSPWATTMRALCMAALAVSMVAAEPRRLEAAERSLRGSLPSSDAYDRGSIGNLQDRVNDSVLSTQVARGRAMVAEISVGTPPQKLRCLLDTASSDVWVPSTKCKRCKNIKRRFEVEKSMTFHPHTDPESGEPKLVEGGGGIKGEVVEDRLQLGRASLWGQPFVTVEDDMFDSLHTGRRDWDGVCGLGWQKLAQVRKPFYERLQDEERKAVFTLVPKGSGEAVLHVGRVPMDLLEKGTLRWAKAERMDPGSGHPGGKDRSFWVFTGGLAIHKKDPTPMRFLVDTATDQVLLVPQKYYRSLITSLIPEAKFHRLCGRDVKKGGHVICECSIVKEASLLPMRIYLGGRAFSLNMPELFTPVDAKDGGEKLCLLQIQPNTLAGGLDSILGQGGSAGGGLRSGLLGGDRRGGDLVTARLARIASGILRRQINEGDVHAWREGQKKLFQRPRNASRANRTQPTRGKPGSSFNGTNIGRLIRRFGSPINESEMGTKAGRANLTRLVIGGLGMPTLQGRLQKLMDDMEGGKVPAGAMEEIITEPGPDGSICTHTVLLKDGKEISRKSSCTMPSKDQLQLVPLPIFGLEPGPEGPSDDLWVLGAGFVERFVAVLDFDGGRIGLAEPAGGVPPLGADTMLAMGLSTGKASWTTWMMGLLTVGALAVMGYACLYGAGRWNYGNVSAREVGNLSTVRPDQDAFDLGEDDSNVQQEKEQQDDGAE